MGDCLCTNWYSRHQLRTFVFGERKFFRIRPGYDDVRAEHEYEEVELLKIVDATNLLISYHAGTTDYVRTTPENLRRIVELVTQRSKTTVAVVDLVAVRRQKEAASGAL